MERKFHGKILLKGINTMVITHTIEIVHFVNEDEVDIIFYEKPYYLEPEKGETKSYALLRDAIKKSKKAGIGRYVIRNREHIGMIKPHGNMIILNQLRYPDEIRSFSDLKLPASERVNSKEIEIAISLIKGLSHKFNPKEFKDTYTMSSKKIIEQKAKGRRIKPKGKQSKPTEAKNLMKSLKA